MIRDKKSIRLDLLQSRLYFVLSAVGLFAVAGLTLKPDAC